MSVHQRGDGIRLDVTPVHFAAPASAVVIDGFTFEPSGFQAYMATHTSETEPGRLVFTEHSATAWQSWERHTEGDELVIILDGVALFVQEVDGAELRTRVTSGQAVLNPAGVWHTADVEVPFTAVYLTPCPGTEHRARAQPAR